MSARNDPEYDADALRHLGFVEWRAGNWDDAARYAGESLELLSQLGRLSPPNETVAAFIDAHRGQIADARVRAMSAFRRTEADAMRVAQSNHGWVLGFIELSLGDAAVALENGIRSSTGCSASSVAIAPACRYAPGSCSWRPFAAPPRRASS